MHWTTMRVDHLWTKRTVTASKLQLILKCLSDSELNILHKGFQDGCHYAQQHGDQSKDKAQLEKSKCLKPFSTVHWLVSVIWTAVHHLKCTSDKLSQLSKKPKQSIPEIAVFMIKIQDCVKHSVQSAIDVLRCTCGKEIINFTKLGYHFLSLVIMTRINWFHSYSHGV